MKGFTLMELIIVLSIIGILATTVVLKWPTGSINPAIQAAQLANDIQYTQALAMNKGERFYLISLTNTTYAIRNSAGTTVTLGMGNTIVTLNAGITFGSFSGLPNNLIAFDSSGTPYTDTASPGTP